MARVASSRVSNGPVITPSLLSQAMPCWLVNRANLWPIHFSVCDLRSCIGLLETVGVALLDNGAGDRRVTFPEDGIRPLEEHGNNPHHRLCEPGEEEIARRFDSVKGRAEDQTEPVASVGFATEPLHTVDVD